MTTSAAVPHENPEPGRCNFFLGGRKARFCRSLKVPGQRFCGNHLQAGDPQRVPCSLDPSHTVLASELDLHVAKRCPALKEALRERAQPHFLEDVNVGSDTEPELPPPLLPQQQLPQQLPLQLQPRSPAAATAAALPLPPTLSAKAEAAPQEFMPAPGPAAPTTEAETTAVASKTGSSSPASAALTSAAVASAGATAAAGLPGVAAATAPASAAGSHGHAAAASTDTDTDMDTDTAARAASANGVAPVAAAAAVFDAAAVASAAAAVPAAAASTAWVAALGPFQRGRAAQRAALARSLGEEAFRGLLARVDAAHAAVCSSGGGCYREGAVAPAAPAPHVLRPPECEAMLAAPSQLRPFDLKHGLQQASIVGNMQRVGLISPGPKGASDVAVVELGAGKGYLGATLAECCGLRRLVAADIAAGLKLKADRRVRHILFGRHRVDLKDYVPAATAELTTAPPGSPWVAVAKHLCGAATDYGLRACMLGTEVATAKGPAEAQRRRQGAAGDGSGGSDGAAAAKPAVVAAIEATGRKRRRHGNAEGRVEKDNGEADMAEVGVAEEAAEGAGGREAAAEVAGAGTEPGVGAATAAAPCTSPPATDEQRGHVCGSEAQPTAARLPPPPPQPQGRGHACSAGNGRESSSGDGDGMGGSDLGAAANDGSGGGSGAVFRGLAIAPCCHHRCGWQAYTGKQLFRHLGLSSVDFELISWMTGWALCGHDSPAGTASKEAEAAEAAAKCEDEAPSNSEGAAAGAWAGARGDFGVKDMGAATAAAVAVTGTGEGAYSLQLRLPVPAEAEVEAEAGEARIVAEPEAGATAPFDPVFRLSRAVRMAMGHKCKQLIDAGRLDWLRRRFRSAELVLYIGPEVTGENRLLLAVEPLPGPRMAAAGDGGGGDGDGGDGTATASATADNGSNAVGSGDG